MKPKTLAELQPEALIEQNINKTRPVVAPAIAQSVADIFARWSSLEAAARFLVFRVRGEQSKAAIKLLGRRNSIEEQTKIIEDSLRPWLPQEFGDVLSALMAEYRELAFLRNVIAHHGWFTSPAAEGCAVLIDPKRFNPFVANGLKGNTDIEKLDRIAFVYGASEFNAIDELIRQATQSLMAFVTLLYPDTDDPDQKVDLQKLMRASENRLGILRDWLAPLTDPD